MFACLYQSPFGDLCLLNNGKSLSQVLFTAQSKASIQRQQPGTSQDTKTTGTQSSWLPTDPVQQVISILGHTDFNYDDAPFEEVKHELDEYFKGNLQTFTCKFDYSTLGTPFQRSVWSALCDIPYGHTVTYSELAKVIGNPKAQRAVGLANNRNPLAIFVPCHRVIGANGSLVGYAGGLPFKRALLHLEKADFQVKLNDQSTREIIIQVALQEFATHGFNGARVDEIALKSGLNKRMIYEHFKNKRELYEFLIDNLDTLKVSAAQRSQLELWLLADRENSQSPSATGLEQIEQSIRLAQQNGDINRDIDATNLARLVYLVEQYSPVMASNSNSEEVKDELLAMLRSFVKVPRQIEPVLKAL